MVIWTTGPDKLTRTSKYAYTSSMELFFRVTVLPDYNPYSKGTM